MIYKRFIRLDREKNCIRLEQRYKNSLGGFVQAYGELYNIEMPNLYAEVKNHKELDLEKLGMTVSCPPGHPSHEKYPYSVCIESIKTQEDGEWYIGEELLKNVIPAEGWEVELCEVEMDCYHRLMGIDEEDDDEEDYF